MNIIFNLIKWALLGFLIFIVLLTMISMNITDGEPTDFSQYKKSEIEKVEQKLQVDEKGLTEDQILFHQYEIDKFNYNSQDYDFPRYRAYLEFCSETTKIGTTRYIEQCRPIAKLWEKVYDKER